MATIGVAIKPGVEAARGLVQELWQWAGARRHTVCIEKGVRTLAGGLSLEALPVEELVQCADWMLSMGGDGTLIWVARRARQKGPVFIGVHFGTLGFLNEIRSTELLSTLEELEKGTAEIEQRNALLVRVRRRSEDCFESAVVNDVVIQKGSHGRILDLDLDIDAENVTCIRADGLIIATPTGSTAYSLSAGGSIVHPSLAVMLLTPICPHSLSNRPVIIGLDSEVRVSVPSYEGDIFLSVDGQETMALRPSDEVLISKAAHKIRFVKSPSMSYYDILRSKLRWGLRNIE